MGRSFKMLFFVLPLLVLRTIQVLFKMPSPSYGQGQGQVEPLSLQALVECKFKSTKSILSEVGLFFILFDETSDFLLVYFRAIVIQ